MTKNQRKPSRKVAVQHHRKFGIRLAHHRHSGRRLPVHCTSYAALFFLLALTGLALVFAGQSVKADEIIEGEVVLSGRVLGPPPTTPAVIASPANGAKFAVSVINISGTCEKDLIIEVYRNNTFAGSDICSSAGTFDLNITLIEGANQLMVRSRDIDDRYAPDSAIVTVTYVVPVKTTAPGVSAPSTAVSRPRLPFLIYAKPLQPVTRLGTDLHLKYELNGGIAPYAVAIDWNDNTDNLYSHKAEGDFTAVHRFKSSGQYTLIIEGTDHHNNRAVMQTIAIIEGGNPSAGGSGGITLGNPSCSSRDTACIVVDPIVETIEKLWPILIGASLLTASFAAGEYVVYHRLRHLPRPRH